MFQLSNVFSKDFAVLVQSIQSELNGCLSLERGITSIQRQITLPEVFERAIASLEEGKYGLTFSSGMEVESSIALSCLRQGDHVVAVEDLYGGTRRLFDRVSKLH